MQANCAYTRLPWPLRELLSFFFCVIKIYQYVVWPTLLVGVYFVGYCYFVFPADNVTYAFRHEITNPLIPQEAAVIPMPTGSHYHTKVLCSATLSGRRQPQTLVIFLFTRYPGLVQFLDVLSDGVLLFVLFFKSSGGWVMLPGKA